MKPLVSVIIPTYSRPTNLRRAIESVLSQTYGNIEIIVVDDNGENTEFQKETRNFILPYIERQQIRYIVHKVNKNGSAARNTGAKLSSGQYISFLDDDDVFLPNKISEQVALLENAKEDLSVGACYCNIKMIWPNKEFLLMNKATGDLSQELLTGEVRFNSSTIMIKREAFFDIDGFDERYPRLQDWEFCVRFFQKFKMLIARPDIHLIEKYRTPNFNSAHPVKSAKNMLFFIDNFKPIIDKMNKSNQIYASKYSVAGMYFIQGKQYKEGFKYLRLSNSYKRFSLKAHLRIIAKTVLSLLNKSK